MAKYCIKCGNPCSDDALVCPRCGEMLQRNVSDYQQQKKFNSKKNYGVIVLCCLVAGVLVVGGILILLRFKGLLSKGNDENNYTHDYFQDWFAEGEELEDNVAYFDDQTAISRGTEGDYDYEEYEDGICITKYNGSDERVQIPDTIKDKNVLQVGNGDVVVDFNTVNCVILPSGLKSIGAAAFKNLNSINDGSDHPYGEINDEFMVEGISDSITYIGEEAFAGCKFENFTWPSGAKMINAKTFFEADISSITLPDTLTNIGRESFAYSSLKSISIPETVSAVSEGSFRCCKRLDKVLLEDGVENLCDFAFYETEQMKEISLPDSVKLIGSSCFVGSGISEIRIPKDAEAGHTSEDTLGSEPFSEYTTLIVAKGSAMQQYASENGYEFKTY